MGAFPDSGRAGQTTEPLGYLVRNSTGSTSPARSTMPQGGHWRRF